MAAASGGPSSPGWSGVEGGLWRAVSTPVRTGGRGSEWVRERERVHVRRAGPSAGREQSRRPGENGVFRPRHLRPRVCGFTCSLKFVASTSALVGLLRSRAGRRRDPCVAAGGAAPGVLDTGALGPSGEVRSPAPAPVRGAASGSSPHACAPRFLLCKMPQASPSRRSRESRF